MDVKGVTKPTGIAGPANWNEIHSQQFFIQSAKHGRKHWHFDPVYHQQISVALAHSVSNTDLTQTTFSLYYIPSNSDCTYERVTEGHTKNGTMHSN